jgi:hypothetical protein
VRGLGALASIPGDLTIRSSGSDLTLFSLLPVLSDVGGDVELRNGLTLVGALDALVSVGGSVRIEDSYLPPVNFENLTAVGGDIELSSLSGFLTEPSFDPQFPALTQVAGELAIVDATGFSELRVGDLAGLSVGALRLDQNGGLTDLGATHVTVAPAGPIAITHNSRLCQAEAEAFVDAQSLAGWSGVATLTGNAVCP